MPKDPDSWKRPTDVIGNAVHVMRIATGEIEEGAPVDDGKDPAAKALGAKGGASNFKLRHYRPCNPDRDMPSTI